MSNWFFIYSVFAWLFCATWWQLAIFLCLGWLLLRWRLLLPLGDRFEDFILGDIEVMREIAGREFEGSNTSGIGITDKLSIGISPRSHGSGLARTGEPNGVGSK